MFEMINATLKMCYVTIDKQIINIENGVEYYLDKNGVKHFIILAEDTADTRNISSRFSASIFRTKNCDTFFLSFM